MRTMIDVERVDYVRVPMTDMDTANHFYGEVLGLERNPNSPGEDWVEYEVGNVTLAVMTPHTHDDEFTPLPPATIALRVPDVAAAKTKLEAAGLQLGEMWDSGRCHGVGVSDQPATASSSTIATRHTPTARRPDDGETGGRWALAGAPADHDDRQAPAAHTGSCSLSRTSFLILVRPSGRRSACPPSHDCRAG